MPDTFILILFGSLAAIFVWGVWIGPWLRQQGRRGYTDSSFVEQSSFYLMGQGDGSNHLPRDFDECTPAESGSVEASCDGGDGGAGDGGDGGGGGGD